MRTIKILGSGPCTDQVLYGTFAGIDDSGAMIFDTDQYYQVGIIIGNRLSLNRAGNLVWKDLESDLFHCDPIDLPRLGEIVND